MAGTLAVRSGPATLEVPDIHLLCSFIDDEHIVIVNAVTSIEALVEAARDRLGEYGVDCSVRYETSPLVRADATMAMRWGGARQRFAVHAMAAVRLSEVLIVRDGATPVLVVAPWISPRLGARLRAIGVGYVDSVGNASVRFGTVLIEVSGRKRPERGPDRPARNGRLLSPANRRVIAALLADPALERATLRELAAAAEVSVGQAHKTVALLAAAGYHRDRFDERQRQALAGVLDAVQALED
jgi:hypothetical protein